MNMHTPIEDNVTAVNQSDLETAIDRAKCAVALVRLAMAAWQHNDANTTDTLDVAIDFAEQEAGAAAAAFYAFVDGRPV